MTTGRPKPKRDPRDRIIEGALVKLQEEQVSLAADALEKDQELSDRMASDAFDTAAELRMERAR